MSGNTDLQAVRRRTAQLMTYEDGLWDLLLGLIFMMLAIYPLTRAWLGPARNLGLFIGLMLILVAGQAFLRRQVSTPRLGYVKPRPTRARKLTLAILICLVALTCALVILTLVGPGWLGPGTLRVGAYTVEIVVLLVLVTLFSWMGYFFAVPRLYLYGWLLGGANLASALIYQPTVEGPNIPMALAAGTILLIGLSLFIRFLRKYPLQGLGI